MKAAVLILPCSGVVGDTVAFDMNQLRVYDCIDKVMRVRSHKRANRMFHPEDSIVDVCEGEEWEQTDHGNGRPLFSRDAGTDYRRGGGCEANGRCDPAWRRFAAYTAFQGLQEIGLDLLKEAKAVTGLPIITEIMSADKIERFVEDGCDSVGARRISELLKELARQINRFC